VEGRGGTPRRPCHVIGIIFSRLLTSMVDLVIKFWCVPSLQFLQKKNDGTPLNKIAYNPSFKEIAVHH
jgi:hypothetical protein